MEAEYRLGFINSGQTPYRVEIDTSIEGNFSVENPDEIIVEPSKGSRSTSSWSYLGEDSEYTDVKEVPLTVEAGLYRRTDTADIQVDLTATPLQEANTESFWKISQERSYTLKMNIPESAPERERRDEDQTLYWEEEEGFNLDQNESEDVSNPEEQENLETGDEKNATQKGGDEENSRGADGMTFVLSAGIVATIVYMIKVI